MDNLITIKTATFTADLAVAMTYLEDNGIKCFLKDENLVQVHPAATSQGVQLQVMEGDVEQALQLLIEGGFATKEDYADDYSDWFTKLVDKAIAAISGKE